MPDKLIILVTCGCHNGTPWPGPVLALGTSCAQCGQTIKSANVS